jgi:hypothetical protein
MRKGRENQIFGFDDIAIFGKIKQFVVRDAPLVG